MVDDSAFMTKVSNVLYSQISHLTEQYVNDTGSVVMDWGQFLNKDYADINDKARGLIENISSLSDVLLKTEQNAARYMMLPLELREFLESRPSEMYHLHRRMNEAVLSRKIIGNIQSLIEIGCNENLPECEACFFNKTKKIVGAKGLGIPQGC